MKSQHAFSLLEMLIALSISAILAASAFPALRHFFARTEDSLLQMTLVDAIEFARQEAQIRAITIGLCKSQNHFACGGDWSSGQLVFTDESGDGIVRNKSQILSVMQTQSRHGTLFWRAFPFYRDYLQFLPTGLLQSENGTFWHCHTNTIIWAIVLSKSGRTRVEYPDRNGVIKDSQGQPLPC